MARNSPATHSEEGDNAQVDPPLGEGRARQSSIRISAGLREDLRALDPRKRTPLEDILSGLLLSHQHRTGFRLGADLGDLMLEVQALEAATYVLSNVMLDLTQEVRRLIEKKESGLIFTIDKLVKDAAVTPTSKGSK